MRIATLNVQCGVGTTEPLEYLSRGARYFLPHSTDIIEQIAQFASRKNLDVLTCTEMERGSFRSKSSLFGARQDYTEIIASNSDFDYNLFFPSIDGRMLKQGNSIHSKFPIVSSETIELPRVNKYSQPRTVGVAQLQTNDGILNVLVMHLSLDEAERKEQMKYITKNVINELKGPLAITGDFNIQNKNELRHFYHRGLLDTGDHLTYPSWGPTRPFDNILTNLGFGDSGVLTDRYSDHLMLFADIALK